MSVSERKTFQWTSVETAHPLIEASEAFPALEKLVFEAASEILLSFRVFDAQTRLRSNLKTEARQTWADLLAEKARQGVAVKLLLTDFEPLITPDLHQKNWSSVAQFIAAAEQVKNFEVICARHMAQFSPIMRALFWPYFLNQLRAIQKDVRAGDFDLKTAPGLRRLLRLDGRANKLALLTPEPMNPATYHQKLAVIDGTSAIVGGLDIDERRYDTKAHKRPAKDTWHDVSVRLSSAIAGDLWQHFRTCWNEEAKRSFNQASLEQLCGDNNLTCPQMSAVLERPLDHRKAASNSSAKTIRTVSKNAEGLLSIRPKTCIDEIFRETLRIFSNADTLIYIETQFFRSIEAAHALARRAAEKPNLKCILLLPFAPEEVSFDKQEHPAHRHGEWLQGRCFKILKKGFGDRLGIFSLAKPGPAKAETGRAIAYDAPVIHLHSKVIIADDNHATITSANLNGRSLRWDTEVGVAMRDTPFIKSLRIQLWEAHFGRSMQATLKLDDAYALWRKTAFDNIKKKPSERGGFILPHQTRRTFRFGARRPFIPDQMV